MTINNPGDIPGIGGTTYDPESGFGVTCMECEDGDGELAVTMPEDMLAKAELQAQRQGKTVEQFLFEIISARFDELRRNDRKRAWQTPGGAEPPPEPPSLRALYGETEDGLFLYAAGFLSFFQFAEDDVIESAEGEILQHANCVALLMNRAGVDPTQRMDKDNKLDFANATFNAGSWAAWTAAHNWVRPNRQVALDILSEAEDDNDDGSDAYGPDS
jgi:hypothetical protein